MLRNKLNFSVFARSEPKASDEAISSDLTKKARRLPASPACCWAGWLRPFGARNDGRRAVSFVEIMIMLLVLSICIIPMIRMFTTAISETNYIDDMLTSIDLAREEVEKIKNLGLSKDQIKKIGNILSPPIYLNRKIWRTARSINAEKDPMEVFVYVFQGGDLSNSVMTLATMVSK